MKYSTATLLLAVATAVSAQDISLFPSCSLPCILDGISSTPCTDQTDFACVCQNKDALIKAATNCVIEACGVETALNEVLPATDEFCAQVGSGSGEEEETTPTTTTPPALTPTPPPVEEEEEEEEDETSAVVDLPSTTTPNPSFVTPPPATNATATLVVPPPASTSDVVTAGAAAVGYIGSVGMMVLGALAAF
ncbi:hypothetical protein QBC35DRAFT_471018 [Podospora australis]|uniref:CFEM domain-containing protein n=1 Tax=Podospora australis TaxID=1536484 RepID=A0AAN6X0X9_9PEZI|nr:hypothetical protein QBC35DRAFT_471018 [Podospora australis]